MYVRYITHFKVDIMAENMSTDLENQLLELFYDNKLKEMFNKNA